MAQINQTIDELRNEANIDFISLPFIAGTVQEDMKFKTQHEIMYYTLEVVRGLIERDVYPGDYDYATIFLFWPGNPEELVKQIEAKWIAFGKSPTLEYPICWFALRLPEVRDRA